MTLQAALEPFLAAYASRSAMSVAHFLSPTPPPQDPGRLYDFWRASNEDKVLGDVRYGLQNGMPNRTSFDEIQGWVDIIACYWHAVDKIIKAEQAQNQGKLSERQLVDVYDAWKDLTSSFIKYNLNGSLPHWTVFTLYFTANNLRKFAIKADEQIAKAKPVAFNAGFQDDTVSTNARNEKLEEAARAFNRIYSLCVGDRWANAITTDLYHGGNSVRNPDMMSSRKWGVYCIANLQFKTYFKVAILDRYLCTNTNTRPAQSY